MRRERWDLPELGSLDDLELKRLIKRLEAEADVLSYRRRLLHGRIAILRGELERRSGGA